MKVFTVVDGATADDGATANDGATADDGAKVVGGSVVGTLGATVGVTDPVADRAITEDNM